MQVPLLNQRDKHKCVSPLPVPLLDTSFLIPLHQVLLSALAATRYPPSLPLLCHHRVGEAKGIAMQAVGALGVSWAGVMGAVVHGRDEVKITQISRGGEAVVGH